MKQTAWEAEENERQTKALFHLTSRTEAEDMPQIAEITVESLSLALHCRAGCLCYDENGKPQKIFLQQAAPDRRVPRQVEDGEALAGRIARLRADYIEGEEFCDWPVYGEDAVLGVIRIPKEAAATF